MTGLTIVVVPFLSVGGCFLDLLMAGREMVSSFLFFPFFNSSSSFRTLTSVLTIMSRCVSLSSSIAVDCREVMVSLKIDFL